MNPIRVVIRIVIQVQTAVVVALNLMMILRQKKKIKNKLQILSRRILIIQKSNKTKTVFLYCKFFLITSFNFINSFYTIPFSSNPKYSVRIDPEEIPEIPQNRFLHRGIRQSPSILDDAITNKEKEDSNKNRSQSSNYRNDRSYGRRIIYTSSGRKIKGRGSIRYRTPSPDDNGRYSRKSLRQWRRSETPPYWRAEQAKLRPWKQIMSAKNNSKEQRHSNDKSRRRSSRSLSYERHDRRHHHYHHENRNDDDNNRSHRKHRSSDHHHHRRSRSSSPAKYRDRKIDENSIQKRKFREFPSPRSSYSPEKRNSISKHKPSRKSSKEKENRHDPQSESNNNNNTHRRIIDDSKRKDD